MGYEMNCDPEKYYIRYDFKQYYNKLSIEIYKKGLMLSTDKTGINSEKQSPNKNRSIFTFFSKQTHTLPFLGN